MDSLPFLVPIASVVFLVNAAWSCALGCRMRHLQRRIELLENAQADTRIQVARQQLTVLPSSPPIVTPVYYPPFATQQPMPIGPPPPYRPMPSAPRI